MKIKKQDFMANEDISERCFDPLIKYYKSKIVEQVCVSHFKEQFYEQLTEGQKALFMFYAYFNHVIKSDSEFYWWSSYYMAQPKSWSAIKISMKYFNIHSMSMILDETELLLKEHPHPESLEDFTITRNHLNENKELQTAIHSLYLKLSDISPKIIRKINESIEDNLQEFVEIEE